MDIIIRNGVIQKKEAEKVYEIKNNSGLYKIPWVEYSCTKAGPYYDPCKYHICVFRKATLIKNFIGPQKSSLKKVIKQDYNPNSSFCVICHEPYKNKFDFLKKRKVFEYQDNYYIPKQINNNTQTNYKLYYKKLNLYEIVQKYKLYVKNILLNDLKFNFQIIKSKRINIYTKYYEIIYKLLYKPVLYLVSNKESKLLWPWELTYYQKFKLNNPDYKKLCIFANPKKITENYIIIE
tara:strand:+ start:97 stop:801 length:705 start_codon:yes stop_codon:yes gene_type:complete